MANSTAKRPRQQIRGHDHRTPSSLARPRLPTGRPGVAGLPHSLVQTMKRDPRASTQDEQGRGPGSSSESANRALACLDVPNRPTEVPRDWPLQQQPSQRTFPIIVAHSVVSSLPGEGDEIRQIGLSPEGRVPERKPWCFPGDRRTSWRGNQSSPSKKPSRPFLSIRRRDFTSHPKA